MTAYVNDAVFDQALSWMKSQVTELLICSGQPVDRSDAESKYLARVALSSTGTTDVSDPADATPDGRGLTVSAKNGVTVDGTGEPEHYCLISSTILLARAEVDPNSPDLTEGSTVNIPAVTFEIGDAVTETA